MPSLNFPASHYFRLEKFFWRKSPPNISDNVALLPEAPPCCKSRHRTLSAYRHFPSLGVSRSVSKCCDAEPHGAGGIPLLSFQQELPS